MKKYQNENQILDDVGVRLDGLSAIMRTLYDKYCNGYSELDADRFNSFSCAFSMATEILIDLCEYVDDFSCNAEIQRIKGVVCEDSRSKFYK